MLLLTHTPKPAETSPVLAWFINQINGAPIAPVIEQCPVSAKSVFWEGDDE